MIVDHQCVFEDFRKRLEFHSQSCRYFLV
ncbi:Protein of unknown function [Cotesia congregata]|uniref:Uncharacterized protein n=1 Tax=Cotesia congregata TaxID=51543 RepID=A0A8J2HGT0_COTCN|nr:Protein of unknown function [Cotesia congregata]CAG5100657.1 Protein of unknown function [Cotesia congregata]